MASEKQETNTNPRSNAHGCSDQGPWNAVALSHPIGKNPFRSMVNRIEIPGLTLTETSQMPCTVIPRHGHAAASICLALAGQGIELNGGVRKTIRPGSLILRAPGLLHSNEYGIAGYRGFMIEVSTNWLATCSQFQRATRKTLSREAPSGYTQRDD